MANVYTLFVSHVTFARALSLCYRAGVDAFSSKCASINFMPPLLDHSIQVVPALVESPTMPGFLLQFFRYITFTPPHEIHSHGLV